MWGDGDVAPASAVAIRSLDRRPVVWSGRPPHPLAVVPLLRKRNSEVLRKAIAAPLALYFGQTGGALLGRGGGTVGRESPQA